MHPHSTPDEPDWWDVRQPLGNGHVGMRTLTLLLTRRMATQLQAIANDLELEPEETALHLLRDTLWHHYHGMQHI